MHSHFELVGQEIKGFFYDSPTADACDGCGLVLNGEWTNLDFEVGPQALDFGFSYDDAALVSMKCASLIGDWPGVQLVELPRSPGWYHLACSQILSYDGRRGRLQQLRVCTTCRRFREVFAPFTACLSPGVAVPDGLARTDAVFGSAYDHPEQKKAQSPSLLVNAEFAGKLIGGSIVGLSMREGRCEPERTTESVQ